MLLVSLPLPSFPLSSPQPASRPIAKTRTKIKDNTFLNSSTYSIYIKGDGNVLLNNICDGDVYIDGENNVISNLIFTKDTSKLILTSKAKNSTAIYNLDKSKIIYV